MSADVSVLRFFLRGWCCSETSLWVRVRTPVVGALGVLLDCVEPSDARLFLPAGLGAVKVASAAALCSSDDGDGDCVPCMGVLLSNEALLDSGGEPESVDVRLRLAGRASSSGSEPFPGAMPSKEPRRLSALTLADRAGLPWLDVPLAPRRVVIWKGTEGARRDILPVAPSVPRPIRLVDAALCMFPARAIHVSSAFEPETLYGQEYSHGGMPLGLEGAEHLRGRIVVVGVVMAAVLVALCLRLAGMAVGGLGQISRPGEH